MGSTASPTGRDLTDLVQARKSCQVCVNLSPGRIHSGSFFDFDPDVISYWSQWLGHPRPELLIVGQDFGDTKYFSDFSGFDDPNSETNANLYELLRHIGYTPTRPPIPDPNTPVFLTNSVLCLKEPPMNSKLRDSWIKACASRHLLPLIKRLDPAIVIAMGKPAWLAARICFGILDGPEKISSAAGRVWRLQSGTYVYPVGHCGGLGIRNRPWRQQLNDWSRIAAKLNHIRRS